MDPAKLRQKILAHLGMAGVWIQHATELDIMAAPEGLRREVNTASIECLTMRAECRRLADRDLVAADELLETLEARVRDLVVMARCCRVDAVVATHGGGYILDEAARQVQAARKAFAMSRVDEAYMRAQVALAAADKTQTLSLLPLAPEAA